jgi:DUF1016 N-terminal domain
VGEKEEMGKPTAKGPNHGRDDENRAAQRQVARRGPTDLQAVCTSSAYRQLISRLRSQIRAAQAHAAQAVNSELVLLYWSIGHEILVQQHASGWGDDVVGRIARDLALETGSARGFSRRNLFYMRRFAALWPERKKVQTLPAQIGWSHHQVLLEAFSGDRARYIWYASRVAQERWSCRHLKAQITLRLHERVGAAVTNFDAALGPGDAERALEAVKDPYVFDFLELSESSSRRMGPLTTSCAAATTARAWGSFSARSATRRSPSLLCAACTRRSRSPHGAQGRGRRSSRPRQAGRVGQSAAQAHRTARRRS